MPGRLVPADEDQQGFLHQRLVVQPPPVDGRVGERADEVVAGAGPAVGHHGGGVVVEARERLGGPGEQGGIVAAGQRPEHVVGPGQQRLAVARREPEGVADHDQRELGGQVGDEVAFAALADPVDDLVAEPFEVGPPAATRRGVNPALTSLRRSLCSGSSMSIIIGSGPLSGRMPWPLQNSPGCRETSLAVA